MKAAARVLLLVLAGLAGLVSLWSLYWWGIRSINVLTGPGAVESARALFPNVVLQATDQQILVVRLREYFAVFGGIVGWISLFALLVLANRNLAELPKWVIAGCVMGAAAAIALPAGGDFAYPPIVMATALLLRCYLTKPNRPLQSTAASGG